jgi:hypothetical protein
MSDIIDEIAFQTNRLTPLRSPPGTRPKKV